PHNYPAGLAPPSLHDALPISDGADAWAWQDALATGTSVGAPPDRFVPRGQDWGLPPFVPHRLRALGYEPFIETIRASLRHGGGLDRKSTRLNSSHSQTSYAVC